MKSLTLNRSTLSEENLAVLSKIAINEMPEQEVISRQSSEDISKEDALNMLWQNFKINSKEEKSPGLYMIAGFLIGVLTLAFVLAVTGLGGFLSDNSAVSHSGSKIIKKENKQVFSFNLPFIDNDKTILDVTGDITAQTSTEQTYTVKSGDSLESLARLFYGNSSPENIKKIQEANNIKNPHSIFPGQNLVIPSM